MKDEEIIEAYKSKDGRAYLVKQIMKLDNFSIADMVYVKEQALTERIMEDNEFISGISLRASCVFMSEKMLEQVKPLLLKDLIKSRCLNPEFEKELLEKYPPKV